MLFQVQIVAEQEFCLCNTSEPLSPEEQRLISSHSSRTSSIDHDSPLTARLTTIEQ